MSSGSTFPCTSRVQYRTPKHLFDIVQRVLGLDGAGASFGFRDRCHSDASVFRGTLRPSTSSSFVSLSR
jgi:hypothetical protein